MMYDDLMRAAFAILPASPPDFRQERYPGIAAVRF